MNYKFRAGKQFLISNYWGRHSKTIGFHSGKAVLYTNVLKEIGCDSSLFLYYVIIDFQEKESLAIKVSKFPVECLIVSVYTHPNPYLYDLDFIFPIFDDQGAGLPGQICS